MTTKLRRILFRVFTAVLAAIWLLPFYWILRSAFMGISQIFSYPPVFFPNPIKLENFRAALTSLPFATYYKNTFFIVIMCVSGILVSCSLSAYGFSRVQ